MAEFERSIIKEHQAEGIVRAKARGVYKGRAKVLTDAQVAQARQWAADGIPKAECGPSDRDRTDHTLQISRRGQ